MSAEGPPATPARRIVSLVPSLTESLFVLGLGERVVGVTEWCVPPARLELWPSSRAHRAAARVPPVLARQRRT